MISLVMIDDRLAIRGRFERRDGMCGGHPTGHHALTQLGDLSP